jgi:hypothetical protein
MPDLTTRHQVPLQLLQAKPTFLLELIELAGVPVPPHTEIHQKSANFTVNLNDDGPRERHADDCWLLIQDKAGALAVIVEVQSAPDARKRWSIPTYAVISRDRHACDAMVLMICLSKATAHKAEEPITIGPSNTFTTHALGPDKLDMPKSPHHRVSPERVMLAAAVSSKQINRPEFRRTILESLGTLDTERKHKYTDLLLDLAREVGGPELEADMKVETRRYFSQTFRDLHAEGVAEGRAKTVIQILTSRGIQLTDQQRDQIHSTTDEDQLTRWVDAALTATTADEVLRA